MWFASVDTSEEVAAELEAPSGVDAEHGGASEDVVADEKVGGGNGEEKEAALGGDHIVSAVGSQHVPPKGEGELQDSAMGPPKGEGEPQDSAVGPPKGEGEPQDSAVGPPKGEGEPQDSAMGPPKGEGELQDIIEESPSKTTSKGLVQCGNVYIYL